MKINSITLKNFYSYKNETINLDKVNGLIFIEGKNKDTGGSNGSGKSSIFEAIFWCLFGRTLRKSTEESRVNVQAGKKCSVRILIDNRIEITRASRPASLNLIVDGENISGKNAIETQEKICEVLNTNFKVAAASMAFGQHNNFDFLGATADDKRTIIRNFLNLEYIFVMRDKIRGVKSTYNEKVKVSEALLKSKSKDISNLDLQLKKIEEAKQAYENKDYFEAYSLETLLEKEQTRANLKKTIREARKESGRLSDLIAQIDSKIDQGIYQKLKVCKECNQTFMEMQTDKDLKSLCVERDTLTEDYLHELGIEEEAEYNLNFLEDNFPPISSDDLKEYQEFQNLKNKESLYLEQKKSLLEEIEGLEKDNLQARTKYDVMRFWEKAFSEQGVIRYVIRNVLKYFNTQCNVYLSALTNGQFFIEFDEELKEKISSHKVTVPYISLSGGEKAKVNLAVLLALQSLLALTNKEQFNLLLFDEVTENMDSDGIRGLSNLLKLIKGKKVFIITHNKELKTYFDDATKMTVIKSKGFSTVKV